MKIGILILLCCVATTSCYSIADFAEKLAERIVAKRDAQIEKDLAKQYFEKEDEYAALTKIEEDATTESEESSVKEDEVDEPLIQSDPIDADSTVFDSIVDTPVQADPKADPEADSEELDEPEDLAEKKFLADLKKVINKVGEFDPTEKAQIKTMGYALGGLKEEMREVLESNIIDRLSKESIVAMVNDLMKSVLTDEQKFDLILDGLVRLDKSKRLEILAVLDEELLREKPVENKEKAAALKTVIIDYLVKKYPVPLE